MEEETINPSCKNCKHFVQHYAIIGLSFIPTNCGHCTNWELTKKERRNFPFDRGCDMWASNEEEKEKRKKNINCLLEDIEEQLRHIKQLLINDRQ